MKEGAASPNEGEKEKQKEDKKSAPTRCRGCERPLVYCVCKKRAGKTEGDASSSSLEESDKTFFSEALSDLAQKANIPAISLAVASSDAPIQTEVIGVLKNPNFPPASKEDLQYVTPDTQFEAASLSKPVFAYLVLKMAERGELDLDKPLIEMIKEKFGKEVEFGPPVDEIRKNENYHLLAARMILSHQASLPNEFRGSPKFENSKVGENFNYSGEAYRFLMEVVERIYNERPDVKEKVSREGGTPKRLEDFAQEEFEKIGMKHSTFIRPDTAHLAIGHDEKGGYDPNPHFPPGFIHPGASLHTTAEDYAKFLIACATDEYVRDKMFSQEVALAEKDAKAKDKVPQASLEKLYWGLGIGLQKCEDGSMIAFHWGDSNTVRNFAALKLNTDGSYQAVTCLTNSANGPLVFQPLCEPIVGDLTPIANWLSGREGLKMQRNAEVLTQKPAMAGRAEALTPLKTTYEKNVPIFSNKVTETEVLDSTVKLQHKPK